MAIPKAEVRSLGALRRRLQEPGNSAISGQASAIVSPAKRRMGPFYPFVVFDRHQVELTGSLVSWQSTSAYDRRFCRACGSRIASVGADEIELTMTSCDESGLFPPQYESWTIRRVPWLARLDVPQYDRDRDA